ncbi:MAG TPA: carboxypeptidase-like regulatory domain-containing protein [Blastocatellia bacterium]|nr:carboxypeptidase-like regulatory domain-containing protein [Blastocatellia bacterium]
MMKPKVRKTIQLWVTVAFLTVTLVPQARAFAQESRGTITGKITDAEKAVVPGASVTITNVAKGTSVSLRTNEDGLFRAPYLLPGTYQIAAEAQGFKKYIRDGVILRVNDTLNLDIQIEVGAIDQAITVVAENPVLDTTTASAGSVVDSRRVAELPIAHGDPYKLIGLTPGVTYNGSQRLDRPFEPTHIVGYAMDGTRRNRSDLTIDGTPSTSTANAGEVIASFVPPQDIVAEFKVQTATFDASLGNTEGGVTNLSIKSGGNEFHGALNYGKMWPGLVANDFYGNANKIGRPSFYYNRFGGMVSGPVWIPKAYKGTNKTFFLYGYEAIREARPRNNGTPTVPSAAMLRGDFSELLKLGPQYQIYNPFTRRRLANGRIQSDPFPNNIIPSTLFNPVAKELIKFFPQPRTAGNADGTQNFLRPEMVERAIYGSHTIRVDHNINDRHRLFSRASWYDRKSDYNNYFDNIATGQEFQFISRQFTIDDVYVFNPTTVLNVRYGYNRFIRADQGNSGNIGLDLTTLGFPARYNDMISPDVRRFPRIDFLAPTGGVAPYQGTGVAGEFRPTDLHSFSGTVNKAVNSHALKWGVEFRAYRENIRVNAPTQTGQFNFDSSWTKGPLDNSPEAPGRLGQSFAALLLGLPAASSFVLNPATYAEQSTTWGFFFHDDWKVNTRLTLNLGLRWEFETPLTERFERSVKGFNPDFVQPFEAAAKTAFANSQSTPANATPEVTNFQVRGGLTFPGPTDRGLYTTPKTNFMPRLGISFKIDDKTVLRTGYGIFYGFLGQRRGDVNQTGYSQNTPLNVSLDNGLTFIETLSNPFQNGLLPAVGNALGQQTNLGNTITFFDQNPRTPYMQRWELSIQRELGSRLVAEISYVGNRGTHIEVTRNINATPNQYLSTSPVRDQARIDYLSKLVPNPFVNLLPVTASSTFRAATIARERLLRPFPQFDAVNTTTNEGYSWYHSLQMRMDKRFARGYTLGAAYTYSKFMEATDLLNAGDPAPAEMIAADDRPHRLSVSGIYEFPFGQGKRFFGGANPVVERIIGGWQMSGIYTYQSGPPLGNWGNLIFNGNLGDVTLPREQQSIQKWINTTGFEKESLKQLASNVRTFPNRFGFLRADYINNYDISVLKSTRITEKVNIQFRAEFLNAFNTPTLFVGGQLNFNPTQPAFGSVTAGTQENYARRVQFALKLLF